jgi:hypothetical protein
MMLTLIAETESPERQHRDMLQSLMKQAEGTVRIASAYVTDTHLLSGMKDRDVRLLTYISKMDIIVGASSLDSLAALIKAGVQCRYISNGPRLHAKVYLFDNQSAVVTSANLTRKAMDENLEVGVHVSGVATTQLIGWFDMLWYEADKLDLEIVAKWQRETEAERTKYSALRKRLEKQPRLPTGPVTKLLDLFETGNRFFVCNTNRRWSPEDEKRMHDRGYAAAWEQFNFPGHMEKVEQGHAIFMYAKSDGIIGIGRAKGRCQILEPGNPDRVTQRETREWRVPTVWLAWKENDAYTEWKSQNSTFFEVSGDKYRKLRSDIKKHFLSIQR